jgi:O-antigen/teichoic acid export membrane protein
MPTPNAHALTATNNSPFAKLVTGAGIEFITVIVSATIGFALTPFLILHLGDRDYGLFVLIGSLTGWFGFVDLGLSSAVTRFVAVSFAKKQLDDCTVYANTAFFIYVGLGVICVILGCLVAGVLAWRLLDPLDTPLIPLLVILAAITFAIQLPLRALTGFISGCMRRDRTSLLRLIGRVLMAVVTYFVVTLKGGLLALSIVGLFAAMTSFIVWLGMARLTLPSFRISPKNTSRAKAGSLLQFGGVAFVANVTEAVLLRADAVIIASFLAVAAVTHFNIAVTLAAIFQSVMVAATAWLMNWFAHAEERGDDEVARSMLLATRLTIVSGGFCLFGLTAWGFHFIHRWVGLEYVDIYSSLIILATAVFIRVIQFPTTHLLYAKARHQQFAFAKVVEGILNVSLGLILVSEFGFTGVAAGTLTASLIANAILLPWRASLLVGAMQLKTYYFAVSKGLIAVTVAATLPAIISYRYAAPEYASLFALGLASAVLYFPLAVFLATSPAERRSIVRAVVS